MELPLTLGGANLLPLLSYVFASTITPGPNNLMLAASARRFGYRRTLPHLAGVVLGFTSLQIACLLGLGTLVTDSMAAALGLKIFASIYLVYLVVQLTKLPTDSVEQGRPLGIAQAALFQLANPKAWIMSVSSVALVSGLPLSLAEKSLVLFLTFLTVGVGCNHVWLLSGLTIRKYLATTAGRWGFNSAVAALTVYAIISIWRG